MLLHHLIEVKKNPEQNPKVSVNSYILDRLKTTKDFVGGTPNLVSHITKPSEELLIKIIKTDPAVITEYPNRVTKAMILAAAKASSVSLDWLRPIAQKHGVQI